MVGVNVWGVLAAAVASFAFGSVWYMVLSRPWLAALGTTREQLRASSSPVAFVVAAVAQVVIAWALATVIVWRGEPGVGPAVAVGALAWFGFVASTLAVNHGFQGARRRLTVIDGGHWLGVFLVQGLVLGFVGG